MLNRFSTAEAPWLLPSLLLIRLWAHVPQLDCLVSAPRGERLAVWAERHGHYPTLVSVEGGLLLSGLHVPQLGRAVTARRGQRLAVHTERHPPHRVRVPFQSELFLGHDDVPQL